MTALLLFSLAPDAVRTTSENTMNALTAPQSVREAVDHARLIVKLESQIKECLAGDREYVYIAYSHDSLPSYEKRDAISDVLIDWLTVKAKREPFSDLLCALDDADLQSQLTAQRDALISA